MSDVLFQNFSTVQSGLQPAPATVASAATIAPNSFLTFITGTTAITTITPPVSGAHLLMLIFTNGSPGGLTSGTSIGNPKVTITATQNVPILCMYDPISTLYWCGVLKTS